MTNQISQHYSFVRGLVIVIALLALVHPRLVYSQTGSREISGKWHGVVWCEGRVINTELQISEDGGVFNSKWKYKEERPIYRANPPKGRFELNREFSGSAELVSLRADNQSWFAYMLGSPEGLVFIPTGDKANVCSEIVFFRDRKKQKLLRERALAAEADNYNRPRRDERYKTINESARPFHDATATALLEAGQIHDTKAITLLQRVSPLVADDIQDALRAVRTAKNTERYAKNFERRASGTLDEVDDFVRLGRYADVYRDSEIDPRVKSEIQGKYQSLIEMTFFEVASAEFAAKFPTATTSEMASFANTVRKIADYAPTPQLQGLVARIDRRVAELEVRDERQRIARRKAYYESPLGRYDLARNKRDDEFSGFRAELAAVFRLMLAGDFDALEAANRSLAQQGSREFTSGPLSGLVDLALPNLGEMVEDATISKRFGPLIANYALFRTNTLGLCGDRATTFTATSTLVTQYRDFYGWETRPDDVQTNQWTVRAPAKFAPMIDSSDTVEASDFFSPLEKFFSAHNCSSAKRDQLERNMIIFYFRKDEE